MPTPMVNQTNTTPLFQGVINSIISSDSITAQIPGGTIDFTKFKEVAIFVDLRTLTGGTSPSVQVLLSTSNLAPAPNTKWYNLNPSAPTWTGTNDYYNSIGAGTGNGNAIGQTGRIAWNITGGPTAVSFYVCVVGKA